MSAPTLEEVKAAAKVVGKLFDYGYASRFAPMDEEVIECIAERLEREQAENAKRDKHIEFLAKELRSIIPEADIGLPGWCSIARHLTQLHPCLLNEDSSS